MTRILVATFLCASALALAAGCGGKTAAPAATPAAELKPVAEPAATEPAGAEPAAAADVKAPGDAQVGDTTTCPVTGEQFVVKAESAFSEFEGKKYYFCCPGCKGAFEKDPAKFTKK